MERRPNSDEITSLLARYGSSEDYKSGIPAEDSGREFLTQGLIKHLEFPTVYKILVDGLLLKKHSVFTKEQAFDRIGLATFKREHQIKNIDDYTQMMSDRADIFYLLMSTDEFYTHNLFGREKHLHLKRSSDSGLYMPVFD